MWHWHKALMDTDRWLCWGYTDHQGMMITVTLRRASNRHSSEGTCTLIIRGLMISVP
ncbi:unnamed protein product [Staurois parvus]|uniref:Uncharacterized protein n=1 Tax=Staurois parvus TaxID=386267 RepID=A0ABN9GYV9_9NEOB|nr:unnamed protein product [Staurois parvus]